ncbi:hypothetical protein GWI33_019966 [Rhynchophorus ferrugineus]|uniref:Homeobox domain-containing protein n=1 Tax=Rhynchophorus ferrugineus TaxID=354439 RepID=A0A834HQE0_RHYFE|nr:hypothetical protein GWI33_019966 [Rhynchophorus ferrugineus]
MTPNMDADQSVKPSDFSIDHILNRAGNSSKKNPETMVERYQWLDCSRYCPPRIPRIPKKEGFQRRQLGRHPRIPFTSYQLSLLEQKFKESPYLSSEQVIDLSKKLNLADIRVKIWFQNRRARERRERNGLPKGSNISPTENNGEIHEHHTNSEVHDSLSKDQELKVKIEDNPTENRYFYINETLHHQRMMPIFLPLLQFHPVPSSNDT